MRRNLPYIPTDRIAAGRILCLVLSLIITLFTANARTISGELYSASDSIPLPGAECEVNTGEKIISKVVTDNKGFFTLEYDYNAPVKLIISKSGFNPTEIHIERGGKNLNIGRVYLDDATLLDEVTVTAGSGINSHGRLILYPNQSDLKSSSTSISLFQKLPLPGLEANPINRNISVDGGTPVILINGVPSTLDDLNALQPKDISKIEYSRFTPARYADQGKTGLLSITLKTRNDGGQIYLWGRSAVSTAFVDANIRASYHQGPSQFTLSYVPSWRNYNKVYDSRSSSYIGDDFRVDLESKDRNPFYYHYHNLNLKYDFKPSSKTLFSATFRVAPNFSKSQLLGETIDSELGEYRTDNLNKEKSFSPSLDLFLRQDINDRNSLEVEVVGTLSSVEYRRDNNYTFADGREDLYSVDATSRRRSLISEISYVHEFNDKIDLSAGFQNTLSHSRNYYKTSDYEPLLTENNNYVYARLGVSVGKVYLMLSSGVKLFWIKNDDLKRNFVRNLTSAQASWNISSKWNIAAAFSYSPSIPSLSAMTDYPQQTSPYLIVNGNPDLKVSERFIYQLMPSFKYKKFNTSLLITTGHVNNPMMDYYVSYLGNGLFLDRTINGRRVWSTAGNLNLRISDIAGFGLNLNLGFRHDETMGDGWNCHLTSFNASGSIWWTKGPFTISYWRKFPGKWLSGTVIGRDENGDALQVDYAPDKHWNIGVSWMYMFDRKGTRYPQWNHSAVNPYNLSRNISNNANMVCISVSYSADFGSIFRTGQRNLNNSDSGSSLLKL